MNFLFRSLKLIKYLLKKNISFFYIKLIIIFFFSQFLKIFLLKKYYKIKIKYNSSLEKKFFDCKDYFSNNIPVWIFFFNKFNLKNKNLNCLEIGSFEGRSAVFLLKILKKSKLYCVDTFKPYTEIRSKNINSFNKVYTNFKKNIKEFQNRVFIKKKTSDYFFLKNSKYFDFIYIDGSHLYKNVKKDAQNSFDRLNRGGLIFFDDFFWYNKDKKKLPFDAIIEFISKYKNKIKILYINYQVIIQKI